MTEKARRLINDIELADMIRLAFEAKHTDEILVYYDMIDNTFIYVSASCEKILGYTREEMQGKKYLDFVVDPKRSIEMLINNLENENSDFFVFNTYIKKDGTKQDMFWQMWCNTQTKSIAIGRPISK